MNLCITAAKEGAMALKTPRQPKSKAKSKATAAAVPTEEQDTQVDDPEEKNGCSRNRAQATEIPKTTRDPEQHPRSRKAREIPKSTRDPEKHARSRKAHEIPKSTRDPEKHTRS